jgi:oxalate---CoA ligase
MTSNDLPPGKRRAGSVGRAQGAVMVAVLDGRGHPVAFGTEGEVCVKGRNVTAGYLANPEANAVSYHRSSGHSNGSGSGSEATGAEVWFRTGDSGVMDSDGFVTLTGRLKEQINRGGEKIAPLEVDSALLSHPAVAEAVAFPAPDPKYGQVVHAAVVLKPGQTATSALAQDIKAHCAAKMAAFKVPAVLHFTATVPRTATGKIQRRFVAEYFLSKPAAAAAAAAAAEAETPRSKL